jgi:phytoene synthase
MNFEAERAAGYYRSAQRALPRADRRNMIAAEIMRMIYRRLLAKMQQDGFHVFDKRYRLGTIEKAACIGRAFFGTGGG